MMDSGTAVGDADNLSCYGSVLAFLNGPHYYVTTGNTLERERPPSEQQVEFSAPSAQVAVSARSTAQLQPKSVDVCPSSPTAIKVRAKSKAPVSAISTYIHIHTCVRDCPRPGVVVT